MPSIDHLRDAALTLLALEAMELGDSENEMELQPATSQASAPVAKKAAKAKAKKGPSGGGKPPGRSTHSGKTCSVCEVEECLKKNPHLAKPVQNL